MKRLENKVAVITGGAGGLGAATAARMVAEGARVVIADIDSDRANDVAARFGDKAIAIAFDAANTESVRALIEGAAEHFGRLDILDNNAALITDATSQFDTTATEIPFEIWDDIMGVNVRSFLAGCKYAIPHMLKNGGGSIINIASGSGLAGDIQRIAYGTSKAAVIALTKYVATQYGKEGIRCNAIAPGLILTEATKHASPELVAMMLKHVLTPRFGEPEDIASLATFLASDEAGYITGQTISCDGGQLAHLPQTAEIDAWMKAQAAA
ncbi:MAG: short-chain dehydrogenase/reductase [Rhizorhabdus sp.]|nr:short-chain dehydrogenase/reductase [Rhizorhabdus sp.]